MDESSSSQSLKRKHADVGLLLMAAQTLDTNHHQPHQNENHHPTKQQQTMKRKKTRGPRARKVEQLDLASGQVVQVYDSLSIAAERIGCSYSNISHVLVGKSKSAKGYFWRYAGSTLTSRPPLQAKNTDGPQSTTSSEPTSSKKNHQSAASEDGEEANYILVDGVIQVQPEQSSETAAGAGGELVEAPSSDYILQDGLFVKRGKPQKRQNHKRKAPRPVIQICGITGQILQIYASAMLAAKAVGCRNYQSITNCCKGRSNSAWGYIWKYPPDENEDISAYFKTNELLAQQPVAPSGGTPGAALPLEPS